MMNFLVTTFVTAVFSPLLGLCYRNRVYGRKNLPKQGALIASNHLSFLDPPVIGYSLYPKLMRYLARDTLFKGFVGWFLKHIGVHPVKQGKGNAQVFKLIPQFVEEGRYVVLFPEGSRSSDGQLQEGQAGIGLLVQRCHCPVIPTYIHGTFEAWSSHMKYPKLFGKTVCVFGSPIDFSHLEGMDRKEAQKQIVKDIMNAIANLRDWYLAGAKGTPP